MVGAAVGLAIYVVSQTPDFIPGLIAQAATSAASSLAAAEKSVEVRYPVRALLGVSMTVDVDASVAHMHQAFATVKPEPRSGELRYAVPLNHPWFNEVDLDWKNESHGKLATASFMSDTRPLKNQKEISDCLSKGLGKPIIQEVDHLTGEVNYRWTELPRADVILYGTYLYFSFENHPAVSGAAFAKVVRALDGCAPAGTR